MGTGIGIQNMRNRINLLHGTIEFKKIGKRTVVFVIKPMTKRVSLKQMGDR
jgi:signal transduction histidine kinase